MCAWSASRGRSLLFRECPRTVYIAALSGACRTRLVAQKNVNPIAIGHRCYDAVSSRMSSSGSSAKKDKNKNGEKKRETESKRAPRRGVCISLGPAPFSRMAIVFFVWLARRPRRCWLLSGRPPIMRSPDRKRRKDEKSRNRSITETE